MVRAGRHAQGPIPLCGVVSGWPSPHSRMARALRCSKPKLHRNHTGWLYDLQDPRILLPGQPSARRPGASATGGSGGRPAAAAGGGGSNPGVSRASGLGASSAASDPGQAAHDLAKDCLAAPCRGHRGGGGAHGRRRGGYSGAGRRAGTRGQPAAQATRPAARATLSRRQVLPGLLPAAGRSAGAH